MQTTEITIADIERATEQLAESGRGRRCMAGLLAWLNSRDAEAIGLDRDNKDAICLLLAAAFGPYPGTARDHMTDELAAIHDREFGS